MGKKGKQAAREAAVADDGPSTSGRRWTVSMAVPGSIIDNTQNIEFATFVAGQVARTAAIFNVDEVVVFDDTPDRDAASVSSGTAFLARVVQFMETPQYLRKALIPMHEHLRLAGLLPPLDAINHHLRTTEWREYREGVVLRSEAGKGSYVDIGLDRMAFAKEVVAPNTRVTLHVGQELTAQFMPDFGENMVLGAVRAAAGGGRWGGRWGAGAGAGAGRALGGRWGGHWEVAGRLLGRRWVQAGRWGGVDCSDAGLPGLPGRQALGRMLGCLAGSKQAGPALLLPAAPHPPPSRPQVVSPQEPREKLGLYWGYSVRIAKGVQGLMQGCPYKGGYDLKIGTSEHGETTPSEALEVGPAPQPCAGALPRRSAQRARPAAPVPAGRGQPCPN
jgi:predicted SPOUT superfamily RNA methylase MTH1